MCIDRGAYNGSTNDTSESLGDIEAGDMQHIFDAVSVLHILLIYYPHKITRSICVSPE